MIGLTFITIPFMLLNVARGEVIGQVASLQGDVEINSKVLGKVSPVVLGQDVAEGDTLVLGPTGRVKVFSEDEIELNVFSGSQLEVTQVSRLHLSSGKVRVILHKNYDPKLGGFQIATSNALATAPGNDFLLEYDSNKHSSRIVAFGGAVQFSKAGDSGNAVTLTAGQSSELKGSRKPSPPRAVEKDELARMDRETRLDVMPLPDHPKPSPSRSPRKRGSRSIQLPQ